uniref:Myosinlike protein putative n=1 Tax=Albugo laibachii Nc14 TaxID=890382 RepID=F0W0M4_9STRA|nr:myosinlike protein putative [Albugo laibachii Nc14]|eukprot:CCA14596.1 myosinlike protein putative [Albugo laibachii Nc14]
MEESSKIRVLITTLQKYGYDLNFQENVNDSMHRYSDPIESYDIATVPLTVSSIFQLRCPKLNQTVFHLAARKGHVDVIRALIKLPNADVFINCGDQHDNTALHFAASFQNHPIAVEMVQLLLEHHAIRSMVNVRDQTPLAIHILTTKSDISDVARLFISQESNKLEDLNQLTLKKTTTYLHLAIERNLVEIACLLVSNGASINIPDENGITVSDMLPRKKLVRLICAMKQGQQTLNPLNRNQCQLCKHPKSMMESFKDCLLCARIVCKTCSKRPQDVKLGSIKDVKKDGRLCSLCATVTMLREKHQKERKGFLNMLHGCHD